MKLTINKNQIAEQPEQLLRRAGYSFIRDRYTGKESFVRRLTGNHYPRLHMYVVQEGGKVVFNLHLDQKQTSYQGSHAHNAEYDGTVVNEEIERLKGFMSVGVTNEDFKSGGDVLDKIKPGNFTEDIPSEKKSWWRKIFNK